MQSTGMVGDEPDVEALLKFKHLKDSNHPEALAIWSRYQSTANESTLNREIMAVLAAEQGKSRASPAPPGGIDSLPDAGRYSMLNIIVSCLCAENLTFIPSFSINNEQAVRS